MSLIKRIFKSVHSFEAGDIGLFPRTPRALIAVDLYCDLASYSRVQAVYETISPLDGRERVTHLNALAKQFSYQYWNDLFPFLVGICWGILGKELTDNDARLIPRIASRFVYSPALGMFTLRSLDMTFLRSQPTRWSGIFPALAPINRGIDKDSIATRLKESAWKIEPL